MNTPKFWFILSALVLFIGDLMAQPDRITTEDVKVTKTYRAAIPEATKVQGNPKLPEIDKNTPPKKQLAYESLNKKMPDVKYEPKPLTPLKAKETPLTELQNMHIKLGFGTQLTPLADIHFNTKRRKDFELSGNAFHLSSRVPTLILNTDTFRKVKFDDTEINLFAKKYGKQIDIFGGLGYERRGRRFYGYNPKDSLLNLLSRIDSGVILNRVQAHVGIRSAIYDLDRLNYTAELNFYTIGNGSSQSEQNYRLAVSPFIQIDQHRIEAWAAYDLTHYKRTQRFIEDEIINRQIVFFNPKYSFLGSRFQAQIGLNTAYQSLEDSNHYYVVPNIELAFGILPKRLIAYAGYTGGLQRNTYDNLLRRNPFLSTDIEFRNPFVKYDYFVGLKGTIAQNFSYDIRGSYSQVNDALHFLNDTNDFRKLIPVYDSINHITTLKAQIQYLVAKQTNLIAKVNYRIFDLYQLAEVWMQPTFDASLGAQHNTKKWTFKTEIFYINGVNYRTKQAKVETLKGITDINIGVEFRVNKNIALWANGNNLLAQNYTRWFNYPAYGLNVIGGIIVSF